MDIVHGQAISQLLQRVAIDPTRYREVVVCTPFLDDETASIVRELTITAPCAHCGFTLLTRTEAARRVLSRLPAPVHRWSRSIHVRHRLHAKVYLAMGRMPEESEAIVTSANLTLDGLGYNEELGVKFTTRTAADRVALLSVRQAVQEWLYRKRNRL